MEWFKVAKKAIPYLLQNDYTQCETIVKRALEDEAPSPFHLVLESEFSNDPQEVATYFDAFFEHESNRMTIAAIYTETNGFDINPNRWYFDLFAYEADGGLDAPDWISDWQSDNWPECTLTGMEGLQEIYAATELGSEAAYLSSLLVVIKFQKLIFSARPLMKIGQIPVYSTGHDYDLIARC